MAGVSHPSTRRTRILPIDHGSGTVVQTCASGRCRASVSREDVTGIGVGLLLCANQNILPKAAQHRRTSVLGPTESGARLPWWRDIYQAS